MLGAGKYGLTQLANLERLPPTGSVIVVAPLIVTRKMHTLVHKSRSQRHYSLFYPTIPYSVVA